MIYRSRDDLRDVRSLAFRRFPLAEPPKGGTTNGAFGVAGSIRRQREEPPAASKLHIGLCSYDWGKDWDIPTLIANCRKAGLYGVEPRTDSKHAHGIELSLNARQRAEVKKRFADGGVRIVSIACGERMDWPQPEKLRAAIEASKRYLQLSRDLGCDTLRVFPNDFQRGVPHEQTIAQIARALNELAVTAADLGQEVSLEARGQLHALPTMRAVMDQVSKPNVRVRLNSNPVDTQGNGVVANFNLVKDHLSRVIHLRDLTAGDYPYQTMVNMLVEMGMVQKGGQAPRPRRVVSGICERLARSQSPFLNHAWK